MREELLRGLSNDQIDRVKRCSDHAELLRMAKAEGVELTSEQLEAISGGTCSNSEKDDTSHDPDSKDPINNPY